MLTDPLLSSSGPYALPRAVLGAYIALSALHGEREFRSAHSAGRAAAALRRGMPARAGSVAVIEFFGLLADRGTSTDWGPGVTTRPDLSAAIDQALRDDSIKQILLEIDSPGGLASSTRELAAQVRDAANLKPIVAIANSLAAAGAYWIGSQASSFFITPGGEVGGIGVYAAHVDVSRREEQLGIKTSLVFAGKYKVEGNPWEQLNAEGRAFVQSRVDEEYGAFTRDVARGRGLAVDRVREKMGQGRIVGARQAFDERMVDGIKTRDALLGEMQRGPISTAFSRAETDVSLLRDAGHEARARWLFLAAN